MKCFYPVKVGNGVRPCGQCAACLVNKSLSWKFRLEKEVLVSDIAFWLTLQYDDEHLPRSNGIPCVSKDHCINYFHKLRRWIKNNDLKLTFKYFLVSEYGPQTLRPHYHALLLFKLPGMAFEPMLQLRQTLYEQCKSRWYHGHVQESLFHSGVIRYLSKYVFKDAQSHLYPVPTFRLISKGIGEDYLQKLDLQGLIRDCWRDPSGLVPRYYRDKLLPSSDGANLLHLKNKLIKQDIFQRSLDPIYAKSLAEFRDHGNEVEKFIKYQEYLLRCQKRAVERKQKQKFL